MIRVYAIFHHFFNIFLLSWFLFRLNRIFQVHDMTINFSFFIVTICLLRATTSAIDGLPSRSISSHVRIVLKGWPFGPKLFISFLSTKRVMTQKCSREMGAFDQHASRHQSGWFQNITILGTCVFGPWKGFGSLEAVASLDTYQITNYQFLQKFIFSFAWLPKNLREFPN